MICPKCGTAWPDTVSSCSNCGTTLAGVVPGGVPGWHLTYETGEQHTSGKAVGSLVCGIVWLCGLLSVVAVILGHLSLSEIRRSAGGLKGRGMAVAGLVLGYLGLMVAIAFIARMHVAGVNTSDAPNSVRAIVVAEHRYQANNAAVGYTCKLADLSSAGLIDAQLAQGQKHGYVFMLQNCMPAVQGVPVQAFQVYALPVSSSTGAGAFCSDQSGVIRFDANEGSVQACFAGSRIE